MPRPDFPKTILEFQQRFPTPKDCWRYLYESRWPDGFVCPRCGSKDGVAVSDRPLVRCRACNYQVSVTAGTALHRSKVDLPRWFQAAFLVTTHTPGFSALQFQRYVGLKRYETAFNMLHKLRAAMVRPERDKIGGMVEVDETYIGGPHEGKRGRGAEGKALVIGAVEVLGETEKEERAGRLRLKLIPHASARSLVGFVKDNVLPKSWVRTDDYRSYDGLTAEGYAHYPIPNAPLVHIHRTFGNLKTWLEGTHHGVSEKHLQAYLNEFVFRHNRRHMPMAAFQSVLGLAGHAKAPTYEGLYKGGWKHPNPRGLGPAPARKGRILGLGGI